MFILSIINAAIILLVNSLRIEDAIAAFHSSDFEAVFWISVFLAAVDALAILTYWTGRIQNICTR